MLESLDLGFSGADIVEIIGLADHNGDGQIDFNEFAGMFTGASKEAVEEADRAEAERERAAQAEALRHVASTWRCPGCAKLVPDTRFQCWCGRSRLEDQAVRLTQWTCAVCSMLNSRTREYCSVCEFGRVEAAE